jgi:hypothetical protein
MADTDTLISIHDIPTLICAPDGPPIRSESDALDLIGETLGQRVEVVVIPVERLAEDFFQLKTGLAGQIMQKFVQYRRRLVILGDITRFTEHSRALSSLVYESNHGDQVWFLTDRAELDARLQQMPPRDNRI